MKILHVVGARPNFMKVAPVMAEMSRRPEHFSQVLVHTGQHYDDNMSRVFFQDLDLPAPDAFLGVGGGSHAEQTARVLLAFEPVVLQEKPDWVFVVGDVNSTVACALVCTKLGIRVAHVEAGLRSWDRSMPEEINRLLTDQISDLLFTPSPDGDENLKREGIDPQKIHQVGNVMIDSLVKMLPLAKKRAPWAGLGLEEGRYLLVTLHRPSNVDHPEVLRQVLTAVETLSRQLPVVFPVHPRTRKNIESLGAASLATCENICWIEPQGYLDFLGLQYGAGVVLTDSGGVQEETTYLGVPCLTARPNTERPITLTHGTNRLVASSAEAILSAVKATPLGRREDAPRPPGWDGQAARRIVKAMLSPLMV